MSVIEREIAAFKQHQRELEANHLGEWVLFHEGQMVALYPSFESAADDAVTRFGSGPFLIREIGAEPITLPASVMYRPHAL
jgi:hypothetical protein